MAGVGMGEFVWLALAVLLGLGVVVAWIIKAEMNRNFFRAEIRKLKSRLESAEREKVVMIEKMDALRDASGRVGFAQGPGDAGPGNTAIGKVMERTEKLEKDNEKLRRELSEARSSLEEVYKALCNNK